MVQMVVKLYQGWQKNYQYIQEISIFDDIKKIDFDIAIKQQRIEYIKEEIIIKYINILSEESLSTKRSKNSLSIINIPLNGSDLKLVLCVVLI